MTAPHVSDDDDFINYIASNGLPDVKCGIGKCVQMNKARSLVCRSCEKFLGPVWWCVKCNLPSLEGENKCRQWMCAGIKTSVTKKPSDKAYVDCLTNFQKRLNEARADTRANRGSGSGGGGGTGGTGGHGAANESGGGGVSPAPSHGQQATATSASDLASCSHGAGGQNASEEILTVQTRSATGDQDAPRRHAPADEPSSELTFTVFDNHTTWLLSVPMLQQLHFGFYFEGDDSAWVRTPTGRFYPMTKTKFPRLWGMICHSPRRGALVYGRGPVGTVTMKVEVTLYPDSGSTVNVTGDGWEEVLILYDFVPNVATGAGGNRLILLHIGRVDLFFPATSDLVSRRAADFPGGFLSATGGEHVKLAAFGSPAPAGDVMLLEGPLQRATTDPRPEHRLNGYPMCSHGESAFSPESPTTIHGLFGTSLTYPSSNQRKGAARLEVGDLICADGGAQQLVTEVRSGARGGGENRHDIFLVSTEFTAGGGFASEGPEDLLLRHGNMQVSRKGKPLQLRGMGGDGTPISRAATREAPARKPRYAMLSPAQAAYNLGLTSQDALKAFMECTVGISDAGLDKMQTLRDLDSHYLAAMEARWVPGTKSAFSKLVDMSFISGQRWLWDFSPAFSDGFDGFVYYVTFMCRVSLFIRILSRP